MSDDEIETCTACDEPAHASETNDAGEHAECAAVSPPCLTCHGEGTVYTAGQVTVECEKCLGTGDMHGNPDAYTPDIPWSIACAAHSGTSFTPEKRAEQEITSYCNGMAADYAGLRNRYAKTDAKRATLHAEWQRFRRRYRAACVARLSALSRCMSTMITGGSNFPTRRNNKRNATADRRIEEVIDLREAALAAIRKALTPELAPIMAGDDDATTRLVAKIAKLEKWQEQCKLVNATIRQHAKAGPDAQIAALVALGFSEEASRGALTPDLAGRSGIAPYELTNNAANIRRLKQRLASITVAKATPEVVATGTVAKLEDCPAENRVRLYFPGKPDAATRTRLKSAGFRWAPSIGCWQAYRNHRSQEVARREAGVTEEASS